MTNKMTRQDKLQLGIAWGATLLAMGAFMLGMSFAHGQEHEHGVGDIPNWYDDTCCNLQDCKPVDDREIDFGQDLNGRPVAIYKPTNSLFEQIAFRTSKDARYHVCQRETARGVWTKYCIYLPALI